MQKLITVRTNIATNEIIHYITFIFAVCISDERRVCIARTMLSRDVCLSVRDEVSHADI